MMVVRHTGLVPIPEELNSEEAAPILCAIATFNAFKKSGAQAGDLVAILEIGGLGHLAVQYARKIGFRVVAIGRGADIADDVMALGSHLYIDTDHENAVGRLQRMGGAQVIMTTITNSDAVSALMPGLAPHGKPLVVGMGREPLAILPGQVVLGERMVQGTITGSPFEAEKTLDFSFLANVRPLVETMPLEHALEAYKRVISGKVKFRMVLTMQNEGGIQTT